MQFIGYSRRNKIAAVPYFYSGRMDSIEHLLMREQVMCQIGIAGCSGKHAYRSLIAMRAIACMLKRFPATLQEDAMLRVHDFGFPGIEPKKGGIQHLDIA